MAVSTAELTDDFQKGLGQWPDDQSYCLAFSAGNDSLALFLLAHRLLGPGQLRALHVHHGLSEQADHWSATAQRIAQRLGRPLTEVRVTIQPGEHGPEGDARAARYEAFSHALKPGEVLLLAHHQDDQVETVLMRLLSGSGVHGLAGMPERRRLGAGWLWRPLLEQPAAALHQVVRESGMYGVSDPSNQDQQLQRGFLRTRLMPQLAEHFPGYTSAIARSVRHVAQATRLLDGLCQQRVEQAERADLSVSLPPLQDGGRDMLAACLRHWLRGVGVALPSTRRLETFLDQLDAGSDRSPQMLWDGHQLRRYRDRVYLLPRELPPALPENWCVRWHPGQPLSLPGGRGRLCMMGAPEDTSARLVVRARQAGDRIRLPGHRRSRSLKNLFQEAAVAPWQRVGTPVIAWPGRDEVLAVGDQWLDARLQRWLRWRGWQLQWQRAVLSPIVS